MPPLEYLAESLIYRSSPSRIYRRLTIKPVESYRTCESTSHRINIEGQKSCLRVAVGTPNTEMGQPRRVDKNGWPRLTIYIFEVSRPENLLYRLQGLKESLLTLQISWLLPALRLQPVHLSKIPPRKAISLSCRLRLRLMAIPLVTDGSPPLLGCRIRADPTRAISESEN